MSDLTHHKLCLHLMAEMRRDFQGRDYECICADIDATIAHAAKAIRADERKKAGDRRQGEVIFALQRAINEACPYCPPHSVSCAIHAPIWNKAIINLGKHLDAIAAARGDGSHE